MSNVENPRDYISATEAIKKCPYSASALRKWADDGKIKVQRSIGGRRSYYLPDILALSGSNNNPNRITVCYARVSSNKQKEDLERQAQLLQTEYKEAKIIKDIGSGLNYQRKGLKSLLKLCAEGKVGTVVVTYRDRLCRYGIELFDWIFQQYNVQLVVLMQKDSEEETKEFSTDILDICNYFVAKYNGRKAAKYKALRGKDMVLPSEGGEESD